MRCLLFSCSIAFVMCLPALVGCGSNTEVTAPVISETLTPEATPVSFANDKCPIMGGKPNAELTVDWDGKTIGFCCEGCPEKWEKLSEQDKAAKLTAATADAAAHTEHQHAEHGDHPQEPKQHADHQEQPNEQQ